VVQDHEAEWVGVLCCASLLVGVIPADESLFETMLLLRCECASNSASLYGCTDAVEDDVARKTAFATRELL